MEVICDFMPGTTDVTSPSACRGVIEEMVATTS